MMATAFLGYVLPWGQMSFWGATVITNLFSAIPLVGREHRHLALGRVQRGQPDAQPLLQPALPAALRDLRRGVPAHRGAAHHGLQQPARHRPEGPQDTLPFHPYYTAKDSVGLIVYFIVFAALVFFAPNLLGHPDNYTPANPLVTPPHIVPEWYFLPFYAILRAVPDKLGGVVLMGGLHLHLVHPALARHQPGAVHALPAPGAHCPAAVARVLLRADVLRREAAGGALRADRPARHALLLRLLPGDPAGARGQGAGLPLPASISMPVLRGGGGPLPAGAMSKPMEKA
jgi:ubiquinol-cytochrome c reductase cytochrome b subunit